MPEVELIDPLDYLILAELPIEGTMAFGVYPEGKVAQQVRAVIAEGQLSIEAISQRLRYMHRTCGYVKASKGLGTSGKNVWQRTKQGEVVLNKWRKANHGTN